MKTYIVLLRGVNVSGKNLIKMSKLKEILAGAGFSNVSTYIQSGNIILESVLDKTATGELVHQLIFKYFNCTVPVFCLAVSAIEDALKNNPFPNDAEPNKVFITFLNQQPQPDLIEKLTLIDFGTEQFKITDKLLYFYVPDGMGKSKMNNNFFENKLKVTATGRNLNTIYKLIDLAKKYI